MKSLDQLQPGEAGIVAKVSGTGAVKRRIIDMGLVGGTQVTVMKFAPLGDPMEIKVKNFNLSLRKTEAALVEIQATQAVGASEGVCRKGEVE